MRRLLSLFSLTFLMVLAACSPEGTEPSALGGDQPRLPAVTPGPTVNSADTLQIISNLQTLMGELVPNDNSATGKFRTLVRLFSEPDPDSVAIALESLIDKINLEYDKYTGHPNYGDPNYCLVYQSGTSGPCQYTVIQLKDLVIQQIYEFLGLSGTVCKLDPNNPNTYCEVPKTTTGGFVYFPEGLFNKLTYVSIEDVTGEYDGLESGLDEYPTYLKIVTAPIAQFDETTGFPIVVSCFAPGVTYAAAQRALLGHRHTEGVSSYFKLLPPTDLSAVAGRALSYCGPAPIPSSVLGAAERPALSRFVDRALNLLLPTSLQASTSFSLAFGGVGGSPEEFSWFGAVDAGILGGGAGGSPEEFSPIALGPTASTFTPLENKVVGTAGEVAQDNTSATSPNLPRVRVTTPTGVLGVANVKVTFTIEDPIRDADGTPPGLDYTPASYAKFCVPTGETTAPSSVEVITDGNGYARLPCLDFGTKAGYRNLNASFNPTGVDPLACMVNGAGACSTVSRETDVNFLIQTVPAAAALISKVAGDLQTAPAYSNVAVAPMVEVTDIYGNDILGATVNWSANVGQVDPSTTTTGPDGTTAVTSWTLGVGSNTLLAELMNGSTVVTSVQFTATGTYTLTLANGCTTGGAKDDITKYGFYFPNVNNQVIQAIGLNLSSNGAPGASENYEVTLTATRTVTPRNGSPEVQTRTAQAKLQSSSNSSKGEERLVIFDFKSNPFPAAKTSEATDVTVRLSAVEVVGGVPQPLPSNRVVNMNAGSCPAGSKNCKPVAVAGTICAIVESQLNPFVKDYRKGLAARVFTVN